MTPWTSLQASSVHGISQVRTLEWVAISSSRESSLPRDWTCISCISRWVLYHWATREAQDHVVVVLQSLSRVRFVTWGLCDPMDCSTLGFLPFTISWSFPKLMYIESVMSSNHLLYPPATPVLNLSQYQCLLQWASSSHQVAHIRTSASASVLPMSIQRWLV